MKDRAIIFNGQDISVKPKKDKYGRIITGMEVGNTLYQNQASLLTLHKGELKEYPLLGVGIEEMIDDADTQLIEREIALQLEADGMNIKQINCNNNKLTIDASYS